MVAMRSGAAALLVLLGAASLFGTSTVTASAAVEQLRTRVLEYLGSDHTHTLSTPFKLFVQVHVGLLGALTKVQAVARHEHPQARRSSTAIRSAAARSH